MGGPIVRSGATPEFSQNWEQVFAGKKSAAKKPAAKKPATKSAKAKPAKAAKKAVKKAKKK